MSALWAGLRCGSGVHGDFIAALFTYFSIMLQFCAIILVALKLNSSRIDPQQQMQAEPADVGGLGVRVGGCGGRDPSQLPRHAKFVLLRKP